MREEEDEFKNGLSLGGGYSWRTRGSQFSQLIHDWNLYAIFIHQRFCLNMLPNTFRLQFNVQTRMESRPLLFARVIFAVMAGGGLDFRGKLCFLLRILIHFYAGPEKIVFGALKNSEITINVQIKVNQSCNCFFNERVKQTPDRPTRTRHKIRFYKRPNEMKYHNEELREHNSAKLPRIAPFPWIPYSKL